MVHRLAVTEGQLACEWAWLLRKLRERAPRLHRGHRSVATPEVHPLFDLRPGPRADWER